MNTSIASVARRIAFDNNPVRIVTMFWPKAILQILHNYGAIGFVIDQIRLSVPFVVALDEIIDVVDLDVDYRIAVGVFVDPQDLVECIRTRRQQVLADLQGSSNVGSRFLWRYDSIPFDFAHCKNSLALKTHSASNPG